MRQPYEYMLAAFRALDRTAPLGDLLRDLRAMGQPPFAAPSPQGWADRAADWISPAALMQRAAWASYLAAAFHPDPRALLETSLGPAAGEATRSAVLHAGSAAEATALLLASPEFQRR